MTKPSHTVNVHKLNELGVWYSSNCYYVNIDIVNLHSKTEASDGIHAKIYACNEELCKYYDIDSKQVGIGYIKPLMSM